MSRTGTTTVAGAGAIGWVRGAEGMTMTEEREVNMGTTDPCRRFPRVRLAATSAAVTSAEATPAEAGARPWLATHRTYEADIEGGEDPVSIIAAQVRQDLRWTNPMQVL